MTYDELMREIIDSDIKYWIPRVDENCFVYQNDISITIRRDESFERKNIIEDFVKHFECSASAVRYRFNVLYNGGIVTRLYVIYVDGKYIPTHIKLNSYLYKIGKIINGDGFDDTLERAGIKVE